MKYKAITATLLMFCIILSSVSNMSYGAEITAECAITIEASTLTVLYEKNAYRHHPMASTTKIVTALVAIENAALDSVFTVSDKAVKVDGTQIGLLAGDKITLKDLLYMLMLKSANDAAEVIAENVAGSVEEFAELMNKKANSLGLKDTHFINPHGLHDENHYTTAYDLAVLTSEALKNEVFASIVSSKTAKIDYLGYIISNSNKLLSSYEYATGVKTGFTKKAGRCLVSSAEKDGVTIITVTLNDANDWRDHTQLSENAFLRVGTYELYAAKDYVAERNVLNGDKNAVFYNESTVYGLTIDGKTIPYTASENISNTLYAPISTDKSGLLEIIINGRTFSSSSLILAEPVYEKETNRGFVKKFLFSFVQILKMVLP